MPDNLFGVAADCFTHTVSTAPWSFMQRQTQLWIKEKLSNERGFILTHFLKQMHCGLTLCRGIKRNQKEPIFG